MNERIARLTRQRDDIEYEIDREVFKLLYDGTQDNPGLLGILDAALDLDGLLNHSWTVAEINLLTYIIFHLDSGYHRSGLCTTWRRLLETKMQTASTMAS